MSRLLNTVVLVFLGSVLPVFIMSSALASGNGLFDYTVLSDGTVKITQYNGSSISVEIPAEIDGHVVSAIGDFAFEDNLMHELSAAAGLTTLKLGSYAFYNCDELETVIINNTVVKIGSEAFSSCDNLQTVSILSDSIDDFAFENCPSLESFTIPEGTNSITIGSYAFYECTGLRKVSIACPAKLENEAFSGCSSLEAVDFPISSIGDFVFENCTGITTVALPAVDGSISIGTYAFYECSGIESFTSIGTPTRIDNEAFSGCSNLKTVTMVSAGIGEWTFENCSALTDVIIFDAGVNSIIGDYAFYDCDKLSAVVLPASVSSIGSSAFDSGIKLTMYVPSGSVAESYAKANGFSVNSIDSYQGEYPSESAPPDINLDTKVPVPPDTHTESNKWTCKVCGTTATGNFCSNCGAAKPADEPEKWICSNCGAEATGNYCSACGTKRSDSQTTDIALSPVLSPEPAATPTAVPAITPAVTAPPTPEPTAVPSTLSSEFIAAMEQTKTNPLTYEEIIDLETAVESAVMMNLFADDTELPQGRYVVGEDLPAGSYTITAKSTYSSPRLRVKVLSEGNTIISENELGPDKTCNVTVSSGNTLVLEFDSSYAMQAFIRR